MDNDKRGMEYTRSLKKNEIVNELKSIKVDITVSTETKRIGKGSENWGSYDLF